MASRSTTAVLAVSCVLAFAVADIASMFLGSATGQSAPSITWDAPTKSADGTPLTDLGGYEAAAARVPFDLNGGAVPDSVVAVNASTRAVSLGTLIGLLPDGNYGLWVRALDVSRNASTWAGPVAHLKDTVPPNPPTNLRKAE